MTEPQFYEHIDNPTTTNHEEEDNNAFVNILSVSPPRQHVHIAPLRSRRPPLIVLSTSPSSPSNNGPNTKTAQIVYLI